MASPGITWHHLMLTIFLLYSTGVNFARMCSPETPERLRGWGKMWENDAVDFHIDHVNSMLVKYLNKLGRNGSKPGNIFVPLCGKSLDVKWLADQGVHTVGLDGVYKALETFYTENGLEWEETSVPALGPAGKLLSSKDGKIDLYCGDVMKFSKKVAGYFDAVWDRAALVALKSEDARSYAQLMKTLVKPGGCILLESEEYNISDFEDVTDVLLKLPPPYPVFEDDLRRMYEPEFAVQRLETFARKVGRNDVFEVMYLLVKK